MTLNFLHRYLEKYSNMNFPLLFFAQWFVRNENSENLFMKKIKIYVWDVSSSAGTKDKEVAGTYKSPYKNSK